MSNLIERLYEPCKRWKRCKDTRYEAADEIERLQKRVSDADECIEEQEEEIERLKAELFTMRNVFHQQDAEIERLQRAYRPADMIEYQELRAVLDRVANATVLRAREIAREALSYEHS
jgi:chromosome segregation ATPase